MYLQTSRLQHNLQGIGVFQTAHSDKKIQAAACYFIISVRLGSAITKLLSLMTIARERFSHNPRWETCGCRDTYSCK